MSCARPQEMQRLWRDRFPRAIIFVAICGLIFGTACQPSRFLEKRNVTYNFEDEGYLSNRVLQTIGTHAMTDETEWGTAGGRRLCISAAEQTARRRSLRVMLHTYFDLSANQATQFDLGTATFERDYPLAFTERDLIRAELDFRALLARGFIALQENRSRDACSVVFRIESAGDQDLPAEIRAVRLTFEPENQKLWRDHPRTQNPERNPAEFQSPVTPTPASEY